MGDFIYAYDAAGNRTSTGGSWARTRLPQAVTSASYDPANRLATWQGTQFSHDENGNLLSEGQKLYGWNVRDQLATVTGDPGASGTFAYDGVGRRRTRTALGTATSFVYDGVNKVQELSSGVPTANLLAGIGLDEPWQRIDSGNAKTVLRDGLGSTIALTDQSGSVETAYTYDPYGNTSATGASSANDAQFTSRENDGIGLYNYRARYYRPETQTFVSEDPLGLAAGLNLYGYASQNPINNADPLGLETYTCKRPLQRFPFSRGVRNGPDIPGNPFFHLFLCVPDGKGGYICNGQDHSGGPFRSPGQPSNDSWPLNPDESR